MNPLDPRLNPIREDLASASLQDRVRAPRYAEPEYRQIAAPSAPVRVAPRFDAALATEALSGEIVGAYDFREGWAWVQLRGDGYVGYVPVDCLSAMVEENTHRVSARLTYLYPAPDMKKPPITKLSFSSTVFPIGRPEGRFVELSRGGFVFTDHLVGIRERAKDFVRVAERFVGVPYLWGGKTSLGIDCSGLVQISLQAAGVPCLRDSDMQMATAGEPQDPKNIDAIQRGDLLFWKGHVAIAQSPDWIIHASGHHMEVVVEPIRRALERTAETDGPLLAILRPMIERPVAQQTPAPQQVETAGPAPNPAAASRKDNEAGAQPPPPSPAVPNESEVAAATAAVQAAAKVRPGTEIQDRARQAAAEALLARPMGAKSQEKPKQGGQR
jgi:cell wall-associated NlpC family hydrolase